MIKYTGDSLVTDYTENMVYSRIFDVLKRT